MFEKEISQEGVTVSAFCESLKSGNAPEVEELFTAFMKNTISIRDTAVKKEFKECFYHGLLLGILGFKDGWSVDSNRESGAGSLALNVPDSRGSRQMDVQARPFGSLQRGYYDIAIEIENEEIGIIIEVKYAQEAQFEQECQKAIKQINDNEYTAELKNDGMRTLLKYGVACYKSQCKVVVEREEYDPD